MCVWSIIIDISTILTSISALVGISLAICLPRKAKSYSDKREKELIKDGAELYLRVLKQKVEKLFENREKLNEMIERAQTEVDDNGNPLTNTYEAENKQNHDALEKLFLQSVSLPFPEEKQKKFTSLIEFIKISDVMRSDKEYKMYLERVSDMLESFESLII